MVATDKITFSAIALLMLAFLYTMLPPTPDVTTGFGGFNNTGGASFGNLTASNPATNPIGSAGGAFTTISVFLSNPNMATAGAALPDGIVLLVSGFLGILLIVGILDYVHGLV
jgi:hypothetical protein